MPKRRQLAEFDYILLGAVFRGFTTGYSIRKQILRTRGSRWSGSTGAVYPALRRLMTTGYLGLTGAGDNSRARMNYALTMEGKNALRGWLIKHPDEAEMGMISDPLRSRCLNLRFLKPDERRKAVGAWIEANDEYVDYFQRALTDLPVSIDPFVRLGFENVKSMLEGRTKWLKRVAAEVGL